MEPFQPCLAYVRDTRPVGVVLGMGDFTIGRSPHCSIVIEDRGIAHLHAKIAVRTDLAWLFDMASGGGTQMNGASVVTAKLPDRAVVELGAVRLFYARCPQGPWPDGTPVIADQHWTHPAASRAGAAAPQGDGDRVGQYVVLGPVRGGGRTRVVRAARPGDGREVFLRVLGPRPDASQALDDLRRVLPIVHPNVVRVLEADVYQARVFAALEPWDGDVDETLEMSLAQRLALVSGLCAGLAAAHAAGLVHGDIDRSQLRAAGDGTVRLDFSDREPFLVNGLMTRRPHCLCPEAMRGEPIDQRSDVFSAACVCHELLSSRRAFEGETLMEVAQRTMSEEPSPAGLPAPLVDWLRRSLAKSPAARYPSGVEMARGLAAATTRI